MKQENRKLLLKYLCAMLPYGVKGKCELDASYGTSFDTILQTHKFDAVVYGLKADSLFVYPLIENKDEQEFANEEVANGIDILDFKPYLFPMSSMTDEQYKEHWELEHSGNMEHLSIPALDWLNAHHFDYRGLIDKNLAIDATGLNVY